MKTPQPIRAVGTAVLGPIRWGQRTGYFRSAFAGKAVTSNGAPAPWYCLGAVDFLNTLDFSRDSVLEFGSGQSTLWWATKAAEVVAVEESSEWFGYVESSLADVPNATVHLETDLSRHANVPRDWGRTFDVVIVDGGDRSPCVETAVEVVAPDGLIILDNSEGSWSRVPGEFPMLDTLDRAGWARVDFNGYAAGVLSTSVTSLFFKDLERFRHLPPPLPGGK